MADRGFDLAFRVAHSIALAMKAFFRFLGKRRQAGLQKYECSLEWVEAGIGHKVTVDVKAKSDEQARQLANEGAIKSLPKIAKKPLSKEMIDPPYIKDAKAALSQWKVDVAPLSDKDREDMENGVFGPAGVLNVGSFMG